jgi:NADH-quinone oxidoreductase subunit D
MAYPTFRIPFGPQHPALKEPEYFMFEVDGEYVVDVKPRIGYVHRGIEKALENQTFTQNLYLVERICGICSHAHTTCYSQAIEEVLDVEIPSRAIFIRTIIAELERIQSHYLWFGIAMHEIGFDTLFMHTWRDRETVMDLLELISGNRVHYAMNTIGGVRRDLTPEIIKKIGKGLDFLGERGKYYEKIAKTEPTISKRADGIGVLNPKDALELCAVGPTSRASKIRRDIRKDDPYLVYEEIPFNIITYDGCDVMSRLLVRISEILESIKIVNYALSNLPEGKIRVKVPRRVQEGEVVSRVEAPRGELIHYSKTNGTTKPERYKVRSPTLANIPSLCKMLVGGYIADIPIILAGIDPCFSCTDRMTFLNISNNKRWSWNNQDLKNYSKRWRLKKS